MIKEIVIDENYTHVGLFDSMKKGDVYKVPFEKKRYNGIRAESSRNNKGRLLGELKTAMDVSLGFLQKNIPVILYYMYKVKLLWIFKN